MGNSSDWDDLDELSEDELENTTGGFSKEKYVVKNSSAILYAKPGFKSEKKEKMLVKKVVEKMAGDIKYMDGHIWIRINYNGQIGWTEVNNLQKIN